MVDRRKNRGQANQGGIVRKLVGVAAMAALFPCPEAAVGLFFTWVFWDNLGNLALRVHEDWQVGKVEKALRRDIHAKVDIYYVHLMNVRTRAEREKKKKFRNSLKRKAARGVRAVSFLASTVTYPIKLVQRVVWMLFVWEKTTEGEI